jgi:chemotaxis protein methyltransferase CheR
MTTASSVSADDFSFVADYLREKSAISIGPGKEYLVESRLASVAREGGFANVTALIRALRHPVPNPKVSLAVVEAMTTNETSFFRDHHPFEVMRGQLLPEILRRNGAQRRLSVWSAASSTGQELYSVAMLLDTHFPELAAWDLSLHGTDLSHEVVSKANSGRFSPLEVNRGLSAPMLVKYFQRQGAAYQIDERLRRICRFQQMNLASPWSSMGPFDIVFCRNVLIYFDMPVRRQILERIRKTLVIGGYLILGTAETTVGVVEGFSAVRHGQTTVFQAV